MTTRDKSPKTPRNRRKSDSPEGRENQLIALAVDRAEQQLIDGTASATVITHYLKLASSREKIELERLKKQTALLNANIDQIESTKRAEALYEEALSSFRSYAPKQDDYT